jgi:uncharacterized protein YyaL (SSP411 family)
MKDLSFKEKNKLIKAIDLDEDGNFEYKIHLNFYTDAIPKSFVRVKNRLKILRKNRPYPFIDKKINTAWNSMMIEALFKASVLDVKYKDMARQRLSKLISMMYQKNILYHQTILNKKPKQKALLEDFSFLIAALVEAYEKTYDKQYLYLAKNLTDDAIKKFYKDGYWFLSDDNLHVESDMIDKYYTAAMNKMLMNILKVAALEGDRKYLQIVQKSLFNKSSILSKKPSLYPSAMRVLLREKRGFVVLKSKKENLRRNKKEIAKINYPFVLTKSKNLENFLACDMSMCFSIDKNLSKVIQDIDKR